MANDIWKIDLKNPTLFTCYEVLENAKNPPTFKEPLTLAHV